MVHRWGREPGLGQLWKELRWSPKQPSVWAGLSGGSELSEFAVDEGFPPPTPATPCRLQH